jgi:hypothetical protein
MCLTPTVDDAGVLQKYELSRHSGEEVVYAGLTVLRDHVYFKAFCVLR